MDMLVPLYRLPSSTTWVEKLAGEGIVLRAAHPWDKSLLRAFIEKHFNRGWADETEMGFRHMTPSIVVAIRDKKLIGFAAYDCTRKAFFGPTGVEVSCRGKGVGTALLVKALEGLRDMGYGYGIIGWAGPTEFYTKTVGAIPIANSEPGIYRDLLDPKAP
jgi:GNAT superfamily N-acetyltransferase